MGEREPDVDDRHERAGLHMMNRRAREAIAPLVLGATFVASLFLSEVFSAGIIFIAIATAVSVAISYIIWPSPVVVVALVMMAVATLIADIGHVHCCQLRERRRLYCRDSWSRGLVEECDAFRCRRLYRVFPEAPAIPAQRDGLNDCPIHGQQRPIQ